MRWDRHSCLSISSYLNQLAVRQECLTHQVRTVPIFSPYCNSFHKNLYYSNSSNKLPFLEHCLSENNHQSYYNLRFDPNNPLQVGGQAVIEGVIMRPPGRIATASRTAN